jgi:prepilin-type N-terminal cleavage/methylation domain-containing protein
MKARVIPFCRKAGFSLVELLVAMTVLSFVLIVLASMMGVVANIWTNGIGAVDNFTKARVMLSLLDRDIQMMVLRRDVAAFVDSTGANPACAFYSNVQGYPGTDARTLSLVQYTLATTATSSALQRLSYGMNYSSSSSVVPTTGTTANLSQLTSLTNLQTETLATGVVAFQWQFVDGTGTIQAPTATSPFYNFNTPGSTTNPRVVIVSLAVLTNSAYNFAIQTGKLSQLTDGTSTFQTAAPSNQTYSQVWNNFLNSPNATFMALPMPIRAGVQVFERHIPLPVTTPTS